MNILFITNHLEPEKGGVADYTRLLAAECERQGHRIALLSLNDRFVSGAQTSSIPGISGEIPVMRIPCVMGWRGRISQARTFVDAFSPDWVSLQLVCYGFNPKGIVWNIIEPLKQIIGEIKVQIMLHELWIGQYQKAKLKDRVVGAIQRFFILNLVKDLKPKVIHTHTQAYIGILKKYDILAYHLPLFGSIPVNTQNGNDWLFPRLREKGLDVSAGNRFRFWIFLFFGSLPPIWPPEPLFSYLRQAGIKHNRKIAIISVGNLSSGETLWNKLCKTYSSDFVFLKLGYQPAEKISQIFNSIDFGIATVPYELIGKSSAVAAMLDHGIPVIVNRDELYPSAFTETKKIFNPLIYKMDYQLPEKVISLKRGSVHSGLRAATEQFIHNLQSHS